jgi:hypothetical protein
MSPLHAAISARSRVSPSWIRNAAVIARSGEGQALADQLASEHPLFAGLRRGDESRKSARVATAVRCVELPSVLM